MTGNDRGGGGGAGQAGGGGGGGDGKGNEVDRQTVARRRAPKPPSLLQRLREGPLRFVAWRISGATCTAPFRIGAAAYDDRATFWARRCRNGKRAA